MSLIRLSTNLFLVFARELNRVKLIKSKQIFSIYKSCRVNRFNYKNFIAIGFYSSRDNSVTLINVCKSEPLTLKKRDYNILKHSLLN